MLIEGLAMCCNLRTCRCDQQFKDMGQRPFLISQLPEKILVGIHGSERIKSIPQIATWPLNKRNLKHQGESSAAGRWHGIARLRSCFHLTLVPRAYCMYNPTLNTTSLWSLNMALFS